MQGEVTRILPKWKGFFKESESNWSVATTRPFPYLSLLKLQLFFQSIIGSFAIYRWFCNLISSETIPQSSLYISPSLFSFCITNTSFRASERVLLWVLEVFLFFFFHLFPFASPGYNLYPLLLLSPIIETLVLFLVPCLCVYTFHQICSHFFPGSVVFGCHVNFLSTSDISLCNNGFVFTRWLKKIKLSFNINIFFLFNTHLFKFFKYHIHFCSFKIIIF